MDWYALSCSMYVRMIHPTQPTTRAETAKHAESDADYFVWPTDVRREIDQPSYLTIFGSR